MEREVKIIHTGDLHLGMTFKSLGEMSKLHRRDCQDVFSNIINLCINEKADALLIAGDLFNEPNPSKSIVTFVIVELKRDKTPRDITAQTLDYASWVKKLDSAKIASIYKKYSSGLNTKLESINEALEEKYA